MTTRYIDPPPAKRHEIPLGWHGSDAEDMAQHASLIEAALANQIYDANKGAWDAVLKFFNVALFYQMSLAKVLREGNWRNKEKIKDVKALKAYVASAAHKDKISKDLKKLKYEEQAPPWAEFPKAYLKQHGPELKFIRNRKTADSIGVDGSSEAQDSSLGTRGDHDEITLDREGKGDSYFHKGFPIGIKGQRWNGASFGGNGDHGDPLPIPEWLQHKEEYDRYDWDVVATHAARKTSMISTLALALELKFEDGLSREQAMRRVAKGLKRKIEAAYKWIDRNFDAQIAPLLKMEKAPAAPKLTFKNREQKVGFTPPWVAIRQASSARLIGVGDLSGNLKPKPRYDLKHERAFTPPPGTTLSWGRCRDSNSPCALLSDEKTGRPIVVEGENRGGVIEALHFIIKRQKCGFDIFALYGDWEDLDFIELDAHSGVVSGA